MHVAPTRLQPETMRTQPLPADSPTHSRRAIGLKRLLLVKTPSQPLSELTPPPVPPPEGLSYWLSIQGLPS